MIRRLWKNYSIFFGEAAAIVIESSLLHLLLSTSLHHIALILHPPSQILSRQLRSFPRLSALPVDTVGPISYDVYFNSLHGKETHL